MSNRLTFALAVLTAAIMIVFHFSAKKQPSKEETAEYLDMFSKSASWQGRYPPDFDIDLINGETFKLSDHVGKEIIVLNFFATWCGPCKLEMPELVAYYENHRNEPFVIVGIDADEKENKVRDFIDEYHVTYPVGIDRDEAIQKAFGVNSYPTTVFIGTDGTVKTYDTGPVMNADVAFEALMKESMGIIESGNGISTEAYLSKLKEQSPLESETKEKDDKSSKGELTGRAKTIAEEMTCPCGCSDKVIDCTCGTAKNIKERLRTTNLEGKTDEEIIRELNKEFCVGSAKG